MFGWAIDKMTIRKSVQQVGAGMESVLDENEEPRCEADGTGVGITGIAKTGQGVEGVGAVQKRRRNQGGGHRYRQLQRFMGQAVSKEYRGDQEIQGTLFAYDRR